MSRWENSLLSTRRWWKKLSRSWVSGPNCWPADPMSCGTSCWQWKKLQRCLAGNILITKSVRLHTKYTGTWKKFPCTGYPCTLSRTIWGFFFSDYRLVEEVSSIEAKQSLPPVILSCKEFNDIAKCWPMADETSLWWLRYASLLLTIQCHRPIWRRCVLGRICHCSCNHQ